VNTQGDRVVLGATSERVHQPAADVLEAMGIPHTEVDLILVNGDAEGFLSAQERYSIRAHRRYRIQVVRYA